MSYDFIDIINYSAGVFGLLLIVVILFKMEGVWFVKLSLVIVLITVSLSIVLGILNYSGEMRKFPHLFRIDSPIHFLAAPAFYFYTLTSLKENFKFRYLHFLHLLPFLLNIIIFMPIYSLNGAQKLQYYNLMVEDGSVFVKHLYLLKNLNLWGYLFAQVYLLVKYRSTKRPSSFFDVCLNRWLVIYMSFQFLAFTAFSLIYFERSVLTDPYRIALYIMTLLLYSIGLGLLFSPELLYGSMGVYARCKKKYSHSQLSESYKKELLAKWNVLMEDKSKLYLDSKLTLNEVAKLLETNQQRLSQILNEKTGMNFNDHLNSLRIAEAEKLLKSDTYNEITIESIAHASGFNSYSAFYNAFKKFTGKTPKEYVKSL